MLVLNRQRGRLLPAVDGADAAGQVRRGPAQAAFLLPAANLDRLLAVAEEGDLLPPKSTWFEPKRRRDSSSMISDREARSAEWGRRT